MEKEKIDFQKIYEGLVPSIKEANEVITRQQFATGAKNGTMGFKVMVDKGEPSILLSGSKKNIFNFLCLLYTIFPLLIVPIFAYSESNWWLLFGIAFSWIGSYSAAWKKSLFFFLITCVAIGYWFRTGFSFYQYISFFYFSSLWGFLLFKIADKSQFNFAMQTLVENEEAFNDAIATNKIMIVHKTIEDKKRGDEAKQDKASSHLEKGDKKFSLGDFNSAITEYSLAIENYPFVSAFENRGNAKVKLNDFTGAIADYSEAIKLMPAIPNKNKFADIYSNRGEAKRSLGLTNEAELDFIEATKLRSK